MYTPCFVCGDSCSFQRDEDCDDGGIGADYESCPPGSDCTDCGLRVKSPQLDPAPQRLTDMCRYAPSRCHSCLAYPECMQTLYCAIVDRPTLCSQIGSFSGACGSAPRYCSEQCGMYAHCLLCTDTCTFDGDGDCDDGGSGSEYTSCPAGSDCADCGIRGGSFLHWNDPSATPPSAHARPPPPVAHFDNGSFPKTRGNDTIGAGWITLLILCGASLLAGSVAVWWRRRRDNRPVSVRTPITSPLNPGLTPNDFQTEFVPAIVTERASAHH